LSYIGTLVLVLGILTGRTHIREKDPANAIYRGFIALLSGDSVHILSRVVVYFIGVANGNLETIYNEDWAIMFLGIGLGATSITMHLFYLFIYVYWRKCEAYRRTGKEDKEGATPPRFMRALDLIVVIMFLFRVVLVFLPGNQWGVSSTTPNIIRYMTNLPFYIMGFLTIILLLQQARIQGMDGIPGFSPRERRMARHIACWMIFSFVMYSLTVFFTWISPLFGVAMVPKTLAYLAMLYEFCRGYVIKEGEMVA